MRRLDQLMNQADQQAKDGEDKASAVTAISMVKIPDQKKVKLSNRDVEKFCLRRTRHEVLRDRFW